MGSIFGSHVRLNLSQIEGKCNTWLRVVHASEKEILAYTDGVHNELFSPFVDTATESSFSLYQHLVTSVISVITR